MTARASSLPDPASALAAFVAAGHRDRLIEQLSASWQSMGRTAAEEAVDQALEIAARNMQTAAPPAVEAYVRRAAWRQLKDAKRKTVRGGPPGGYEVDFDSLPADALSPEELVLARENRDLVARLLHDALADLDERGRAVMHLKHVVGLERKAVAARLGLSEKQVKKTIERAHKLCSETYLAAAEGRLCERRRRAVIASALGTAGPVEARSARSHVAHCRDCRTYFKTVKASQRAATALLPLPLLTPAHHGSVLARLAELAKLAGLRLTGTGASDALAPATGVGAIAAAKVAAASLAAAAALAVTPHAPRHAGAAHLQAPPRAAVPAVADRPRLVGPARHQSAKQQRPRQSARKPAHALAHAPTAAPAAPKPAAPAAPQPQEFPIF